MISDHPLVMISLACSLAEFGIYLSDSLPFYVRDGSNVWYGYCNYEGDKERFEAETLPKLKKLMREYYDGKQET